MSVEKNARATVWVGQLRYVSAGHSKNYYLDFRKYTVNQ